MNRIFLIDGHAQIFRMYYAFMRHPMVNSKGRDTSIIFGFTKMLLELIEKERPTHIAVAFDPPAKTFRHEAFPEYKANRSAAPELVKEALEPLTEIMQALNIPVVMVPGFEADDVIGSMASQWSGAEDKIYMVTPDKDYGQLISENVYQYKPAKGGTGAEIIDREQICNQYGISDPRQVADILAIWGDASDNVPGVRGIGEVGAKKLVSRFGSVEGVVANSMQLPVKQQEAIKEAENRLGMSKFLVTIKRDIELPLQKEEIKIRSANKEALSAVFNKYEINSLRKLLGMSEVKSDATASADSFTLKTKEVSAEEFALIAARSKTISIKFTDERNFIAASDGVYTCAVTDRESGAALKEIMENPSVVKTGTGFKQYIKYFRAAGIDLNGALNSGYLTAVKDIEIMHYVLDPERSHNVRILVRSFLGAEAEQFLDAGKAQEKQKETDLFSAVPETEEEGVSLERAINECALLLPLCMQIWKKLEENRLSELYDKIEMPLIAVLSSMELEGVKIDTLHLKNYSRLLNGELNEIERQVRQMAGEPELNISSPKQIGLLLYEKLQLSPKTKKSPKGNYPTDEEKLNELKEKHPIVEKIMEYRGLKKLLSTYIDNFPQMIDRDGKLHTSFNQSLTATGRLSSSNPNLQNIPIRTERGREIRKAFVPSTEHGAIVSADYSQIELRLMAHMSADSGLVEAFNHNKDIHTATAARIFREREEDVTKEQRSKAKTANFGIIYGISSFGLSQRIGMSRSDSKALIDEYFSNYPGVREYIDRMIEHARQNGYVETIFGRRRFLPDINSRNSTVRGFNERNAINAPLQGSAADIIKLAMINVYKRLQSEGFRSRMVLQVHDELVLDTVEEETESVKKLLKEEMESIVKLRVPLIAECNAGANWLEAH